MQTSPSPTEHDSATQFDPESYSLLKAFAVALLLFVLSQYSLRWLPAYHDAAVHWNCAQDFFAKPWFPFVQEHDTGHPPLVAWALGLLWHLPIPRLLSMHLLSWSAAALLCAATFEIGRRTLGFLEALCIAGIVGLHPVVLAQALQLNLDVFQIAFAWTAVAGIVAGRPWQVAIALTASTMSKLNGAFAVPPVTLWLLWRLYREGGFRDARRIAMALWPVAIPTAVFLGYHTLKWRLTGHFLVSPEFQDANLGRVSGPLQYLERMWHSVNQLTGFHNPCFWMLIMTAVLTLVIAIRLREPDFAGRLRSALRVVQPARDPARFFRATSVGETAVLAWLMALAHLGFWSLRQYFSLVRYMMVAYPTLALTLVLTAVLAFPHQRRRALWAVTVPVLLLCFLTAHPSRVRWLPQTIAEQFYFPPNGVDTNHENNLELVDELEVARDSIRDIEQSIGPSAVVETRWPFNFFFSDPSLGMVHSPFQVVWANGQVIFLPGNSLPGSNPGLVTPLPGYRQSAAREKWRVTDFTFQKK